MIQPIGSLFSRAGEELLKMWQVQVEPGRRLLQCHSHTRFEIVLVESGGGDYTTDCGVLPMEPGDVFVFASNEFHCITDVKPEGLVITNLHFEPRYILTDAGETLGKSNINFCFGHQKGFENRLPDSRELAGLMMDIRRELTEQGAEYALAVRSLLNLFIVRLLRHHGYEAEQHGAPQLSGILRAMGYIDEHLGEAMRLEDISAAAGMSPNYFSTLFKRLCRVTLWDYIIARRVEKAIRLICADSGQTMLEIALACGFNNTANFNKAFRKQTGLTPTHYRTADDWF